MPIAAGETSPLDGYVSNHPAPNEVRVPPMPKLAGLIDQHGYKAAAGKYDEGMEEWRGNLEKLIAERLSGKAALPASKLD